MGYRENDELWTIMSRRAMGIALAWETGPEDATASYPVSGLGRVAAAVLVSASERPRTGFVPAPVAHARRRSSAPSGRVSEGIVPERAVREVEAFENPPSFAPADEDGHGKEAPSDPLRWWVSKAHDFLGRAR